MIRKDTTEDSLKQTLEDEGFLRRWSRLKSDEPRLPPELPPELPVESEAEADSNEESATAEAPAEPVAELTDEDMPPLESLDESSDYSQFMSPGVSDELRNLALRKLFRKPRFNIRDGLDDYDEDFRNYEKLGDIVTSDMRLRQEREDEEAEREREKLAAEQSVEPSEAEEQEEARSAQADDQAPEQSPGQPQDADELVEDDEDENV